MENPTQVLIVGKNEAIVLLLKRLVNRFKGLHSIVALCDESAIDTIQCQPIELVILSSGLSEDCENRIKENALAKNQGIKIIAHFGGGRGLLKCEISEAFGKEIEWAEVV